jgi:hypothetical protein
MYLLKGMSKKRPTRAPYRVHDLAGMKKRHPYAHLQCSFKELRCHKLNNLTFPYLPDRKAFIASSISLFSWPKYLGEK